MYVRTYRHIKQHYLIGCPHYRANLCSCREVKLRHILTKTAFSEVYGGEIASGVCIHGGGGKGDVNGREGKEGGWVGRKGVQIGGRRKGYGWEGGERAVDGREEKGRGWVGGERGVGGWEGKRKERLQSQKLTWWW